MMARHGALVSWFATWLVIAAGLVGVAGCGEDDGGEPPVFAADYAKTYQEVRNCRRSFEHDVVRVRVLAAPEALAPYTTRNQPFPTGAIVLKEEYDEGDDACAGPIVKFTVMQKLDAGSSPVTLDWRWQEVNADRETVAMDVTGCTRCHSECEQPPDGFDGTCAMP